MGLAFLGMTSSAWAQGAFIDETLKSRMQAGEKAARVIIVTKEVDEDKVADDDGAERSKATDGIAKILRSEAPNIRSLGDGSTHAATLTAKGLDALAKSKDVVAVVEDIVYKRAMFDTHPIVRVDEVQRAGLTGLGGVVVIIDDGFDTSHPFIRNAVVGEACFSESNQANGLISLCRDRKTRDVGRGAASACGLQNWDCKHGTHVAGIVGGRGGPETPLGKPLEGVAPGVGLYLIKAYTHDYNETKCDDGPLCGSFYASTMQRALSHVISISKKFNIVAVNLSIGSDQSFSMNCETTSKSAKYYLNNVNKLIQKNIAVIFSAGNEFRTWGVGHPACLTNAFAVGSIDKDEAISSFSNTGLKVDVLAPGRAILSAQAGGGYVPLNGTSMAAPYVTGIIALLREVAPKDRVPVQNIYDSIRRTGKVVQDSRNGLYFPIAQADKAIEAIRFTLGEEARGRPMAGSGQQPAATPVAAPVPPPRPVAPAAEPGLAGAPQPVQPAAVPQPQRPAAPPAPSGGGINDILRQTAPKANPFQ